MSKAKADRESFAADAKIGRLVRAITRNKHTTDLTRSACHTIITEAAKWEETTCDVCGEYTGHDGVCGEQHGR